MDPSYFIGNMLGAFIAAAAMPPGACDPRGVCYQWYDERRIAPQYRYYTPPRYPPPPQYQDPPPPPPPSQKEMQEGADVKAAIYDFCSRHPEERFCGMLEAYLQHHPNAR